MLKGNFYKYHWQKFSCFEIEVCRRRALLVQHASTALRIFFSKKKTIPHGQLLFFLFHTASAPRKSPDEKHAHCLAQFPPFSPSVWLAHPLKRSNETAQVGWKGLSVLLASQHRGDLKDFSLCCTDSVC